MCGINGFALSSRSARRVERETLERMRDVLAHRGPDDAGIYFDGAVGLGHRRLSIVDVAAGHQPMTNEDGSLLHRLQRRGLQPRRLSRRTRSARPRLPHALRHRNDSSSLRRRRRALRRTAARHVRLRHLGQARPRTVHRARPARRQAALLRSHRRRLALFRVGDQSACSRPAPSRRN